MHFLSNCCQPMESPEKHDRLLEQDGVPSPNCMAVVTTESGLKVQYRFINEVGSGSFGSIWLGRDLSKNEIVAIKVEKAPARQPHLYKEYTIYKTYLSGVKGFPEAKHFSRSDKVCYFVMTMLGESLQKLLERCGGQFSLKTVIMIVVQLLHRLETLHELSGHVMRDVKPENILMGTGENSGTLYLVDLGLAKSYLDPDSKTHIDPRGSRKSLTGTARYASINAHFGNDHSRRDDLEAAGYVFVYFLRGRLPWQGIRDVSKQKRYDKIRKMKEKCRVKDLCAGLPSEFFLYLEYCRGLSFKERPDYSRLRGMFRNLFYSKGYAFDDSYDWTTEKKCAHLKPSQEEE